MADDSEIPETLRARLPEMLQALSDAVRRSCPSWLSAQADDIAQVALLKVVEAARRGDPAREIGTSYLWRVAHSSLVDEIRRRRRRREVALDPEVGEHEPVSDRPDPEREAASQAIGSAIVDCLRRLVDDRRHAVTLHLEGHTVGEIARILEWLPKRAENAVYRGLGDLRRCLTGKGIRP